MLVRKTPNMYEREGQRVGAVCCLKCHLPSWVAVLSRLETWQGILRLFRTCGADDAPREHVGCRPPVPQNCSALRAELTGDNLPKRAITAVEVDPVGLPMPHGSVATRPAAAASERRLRSGVPKIFARVLLAALLPAAALSQTHVAWMPTPNVTGGPPEGRAAMAYTQQSINGQSGGATDTIWMYGGISSAVPLNYSAELWSFTASSGVWEIAQHGNSPPPLVGSAMCAVGHTLYLYGGANFDANAHAHLYVFDTATRSWSISSLSGHWPPAKAYHGLSCAGGRVYLFGGQDTTNVLQNDLHVLANLGTNTMAWSMPTAAGNVPTARKSFSLSHANAKLYLFGGSGAAGEKLNDAYAYDTSTLSWSALATSGDTPTGREGHTASVLDEKLYIFGGADGFGNVNDVRVLDLGSHRWSHPRSSGAPPEPRWGHLGALINQRVYLYGGIGNGQHLLTDTWTMSRHCLGSVAITAARGSFVSGEGSYLASTECQWTLSPSLPNRQVRLYFSSFGFEQGSDFVSVFDGPTAGHQRIARLTGHSLPPAITSTNGSLTVVMTTDAATADIGFEASYFDECTAGYIPSSSGSQGTNELCDACAAGHYSPATGMTECTLCDAHQYQPETGQSRCLDCPAATRAGSRGATSVEDCVCYPGFYPPNGTGTDCFACPSGATCPGGGVGMLANAGFCLNSTTVLLPCCDVSQCPGGDGACPTTPGSTGEPGAQSCPAVTILTMGVWPFVVSVSAVTFAALCCFCCGQWRGRRVGASMALRDFVHRLDRAANAPQIGTYTSALAADTSLKDLTADVPANGTLLGGCRRAVPVRGSASIQATTQPSVQPRQRNMTPPVRLATSEQVGLTLVDLESAVAEEALLVEPSPASARGGGPPVMRLQSLQQEEGDLFAPSESADDPASPEEEFAMPPPTPPRKATIRSPTPPRAIPPPTPPRQRSQPPPPVDVNFRESPAAVPGQSMVGTCLVQVPDENGRWQPVKLTASMCGSPVGSINPSLAPSESTLGGRSHRMMARRAESIPEEDRELDYLEDDAASDEASEPRARYRYR